MNHPRKDRNPFPGLAHRKRKSANGKIETVKQSGPMLCFSEAHIVPRPSAIGEFLSLENLQRVDAVLAGIQNEVLAILHKVVAMLNLIRPILNYLPRETPKFLSSSN